MPYPIAPPQGLAVRRWTALWPFSRSHGATLVDMALAGVPTLALLLPFLLFTAPSALTCVGLIVSATCLFSASCVARQRLERDESIRVHARLWDRIIRTPLPTADATDLDDNAMRRAFLLERGLEGALTIAAERRNCIASAAVITTAAVFLPDHTFHLLLLTHIPTALGIAFLVESGRLALGQRAAVARRDLSTLERRLAHAMPMLRQHGASKQKIRELEAGHLEFAASKHTERLVQLAVNAIPILLATIGLVTTLSTPAALTAGIFPGLLLLLPAIWCAADGGVRLARLRDAGRRVEALKPLGLHQSSNAADHFPLDQIESVQLKAVGFRYEPDTPPILSDFSINVSRGQIIALTGSSGSGKSTLLNILMGLTAPQVGTIIVNGMLRDWHTLSNYRARIAGILQDTPIGLSSIRAFIGQNALMAPEAVILQAAADAGLANAIADFPMGMQSLVAEGGFPRSLGQQLLIARALAQQPDLLFIDETFSTLDQNVVETVIAAIRRRRIALVFVTHRSDLAVLADHSISLDPLPASSAPSKIQNDACAL
ncbi:ATP-binding cassette domain-containing protein (plasmid) [Shinella sp. H4-D48]|uniref:ATP-binding cassette domain-containing protein n=1 Tax=Shinella sp. H4-D48 TaxID=2925841 RepID=UPI001F53B109|nr:ATP-binding cassette domain-containing protein [Shinella sp. H4-D48]UNK39990.1 ATP-binding cassette domain-containing protein [Shinella sp. H4-D48]